MADLTTVLSVAGAGVGIHLLTDIETSSGRIFDSPNAFRHLVAGGVFMFALSFLALVNVDLALAFAILFLVIAFVNKNDPVAQLLVATGSIK